MTSVYKYNNSIIIENGAIGISPSCCCGCVPPCCNYVRWTYTLGGCNNVPEPQVVDSPVDAGSCYSYFVWEDWDCQNPLVGRDCGEGAQCNVYARVKVTCSDRDEARGGCGINCTLGPIQYTAADNDQWGGDSLAACDCADSFGSLTAEVCQDPPPPPCDGTCSYFYDNQLQIWILLGNNCSENCGCPEQPINNPNPELIYHFEPCS